MHLLNSTFPPLHSCEAVHELYEFFLGRLPTHSEHMWVRNNCNDPWLTNGVMAFSQPWDSRKPVLLVYSCCHAAQLLTYWANFSVSNRIKNSYNLVYLSNYRVQGDTHYQPGQAHIIEQLPADYRELFIGSWSKADVVITHPAYGNTEFSPDYLGHRYCREGTPRIQFHSPSFEALWPICPNFGDEWVKKVLREGVSPDEIKQLLMHRLTGANLTERFPKAVDRLIVKDRHVDTPIANFFQEHYRTHRMFVTFNHPSFTLMAYQAMMLERMLEGVPRGSSLSGEDINFILHLPWNSCNFQPVFPDHPISHTQLNLRYPAEYPDVTGFYNHEIDRCATEVAAEGK